MAKIVYAEYRVCSSWDLNQICEELDITYDDVVEYYVKWDKLFLTYTDSDGDEVEVEYNPNLFCASEQFDWKRPTEEHEWDEEEEEETTE
jgi:hypothetical protein